MFIQGPPMKSSPNQGKSTHGVARQPLAEAKGTALWVDMNEEKQSANVGINLAG